MEQTPDSSETEAVEIGEKHLRERRFEDLLAHCRPAVERFETNPALWCLLGVAHGNLRNPQAARMSFLNALLIDPSEPHTLSNYILACFDAGDKAGGVKAVSRFFNAVDFNGQKIVLESLAESCATGLIAIDDLPASIRSAIENAVRSEPQIEEFAVEVNGAQIIYHETDVLPASQGFEVSHAKSGITVAFIAGSRFEKSKPTTVFIMSFGSQSWLKAGLEPDTGREQLRGAIESLAQGAGRNFASFPPSLPGGFQLKGRK